MARQAYPDVPLFRYDYADLSLAQIADKLRAPALGGPGSRGTLEDLGAAELRFTAADGTALSWQFAPNRRVSFDGGAPGGYGALTLGHVTLVAHLVPGTTRGYAIAWDQQSNRATVVELWFGGGPAPKAREVNRAIWHGIIVGPAGALGGVSGEEHRPTVRMEGRALAWTEDTGMRTVEYYPSVTYNHWVELDRLKEGRGYSAPADYIQVTAGHLPLHAHGSGVFRPDAHVADGHEPPRAGRLAARVQRVGRAGILHVPRPR